MVEEKQFDAAEEVASKVMNLIPSEGNQFAVCKSHRILGKVYQSKGEVEEAVGHYNMALGVASSFDWHDQMFWAYYALAELFCDESRFDDAYGHLEHAKSHAANDAYQMGRAVGLQAWVLYGQGRSEEARLGVQHALNIFERIGAAQDLEKCKKLLQDIQTGLGSSPVSGRSGDSCEFL